MIHLNPVETTVLVSGQKTHFVKLELRQNFFQHHRCEILVDHDALGDKQWMLNPMKIFKLIGQSLSITMMHKLTGETNVFNGLVSNISFVGGKSGAQNYILIEGAGETIKLAGKPTMDSFVDKDLDSIVSEVAGNSGNGASITVQSKYKKPVYFAYQYNENAFDFINRLCYIYGESFWYDGTTIYFGKPEAGNPVVLQYESEVTDYNLRGSLLPSQFRDFEYVIGDDQEWQKPTRKAVPETVGYLQPIADISDEIYQSVATKPSDASVSDSDSILNLVDAERTRAIANMLVVTCKTQTCKAKIGEAVTIQFPLYMGVDTSAGVFIITDITHTIDQKGHYSNEFSGVRQALEHVPMAPVPMPVAVSQRATVVSNADPENKGRVKVQFQWMKLSGKESNWIRVQTPDAGGSDKVNSNRGLVTIPEEGDTVMVGFEYGDPNRPYTSGSLFTSKNGGGGGQGNRNKSLTTRSGCTVSLDDDKGSVTVKDPSGNIMVMDGSGNISITAPNTFTIKAKDIKIDAGNSIAIDSGSDGEGTIGITAKKSIEATAVTENITLSASAQEISLTAKTNLSLEGKTSVLLQKDSSNKINISDAIVDIDGGEVQIN